MALGKRLINTGAAAACTTDSTDPFGDSSGVALYSLDYDSSDAGGLYDGTPTDVDFGVDGEINYGARFNGSSSKIVTGINSLTNNFTISMWLNTNSLSSSRWVFNNWNSTSQDISWSLETDGTFDILIDGNDGSRFFGSSGDVAINTWHHVVLTMDSGNYEVYLDSVSLGTGSTTNTTFANGQFYQIGSAPKTSASVARWDGTIDQVRIFSKALNQTEVDTLFAEEACVYTSTTDIVNYPTGTTPVAYYKMDNSSEDYSTGGNDGTDTNVEYRFGRFGQAADFNGSSSKITLPTGSPFNDSDTIKAVSAWVKADTSTSRVFPFSISSTTNTNDYWYIGYMGDIPAIYIATRDGSSSNQSVASVTITPDTNWHHLVVQITATEKEIYLDGVKQTITNSNSGSGTNTSWISYPSYSGTVQGAIGVLRLSSPQYSNGFVDQVRIYDAALTSDQVTELYNEKPEVDTVTAPTGNLRFDEFWAGYDDGRTNRAEFKSSGQIVDFNAYSEGHAVLNQNAQTSGKYYLEIELVSTSGHDGFGVFNRSTNTVYDDSPYASKNPIDSNYGATLYARGSLMYLGNVSQSGFTNLSLGDGDIVCMAVNVDEKRIWWGRRDGLSDSEIVWSNGNPNGGYGGLEVSFVPSDVIVTHASETSSRFSEFKVLNHADMLEPPFNFSYLDGPNTASLTENEANF